MEEPYGKRLNRAGWNEYRKFWSGMRLLVTLSGLLAPGIIQAQRGIHSVISLAEAMESGALGLLLSLSGTYLYSWWKGAEALDAERGGQAKQHLEIINSQKQQIEALSNKPKRTPAEEHHFAQAKAALQRIGPDGIEVLRHLHRAGSMTFGNMAPPLPPGMTRDGVQQILNLCWQQHGLVTREESRHGLHIDYVYKIAQGMQKALDELLFS